MVLDAYVNPAQVGAFGQPSLSIGSIIALTLVGNRGSTLDPTVGSLDYYLSGPRAKVLKRTGLCEYSFGGEVLKVRSRKWGDSLEYTEALVDCGIPIIIAEHRSRWTIGPHSLGQPSDNSLAQGRYLGGLTLLFAHIVWSFRDPPLIDSQLEARVVSISEVDLTPDAVSFGGLRELKSIDYTTAILPVILGIDI